MQQNKYPKIFVIILNYNGLETISSCLHSVNNSDYPNFEIAFVDNDSKDGSFELAKQLFSKVHFIKNDANIGFARGNNIGIRFTLEKMADYIFLLNNDAVVEKDTLSNLVKIAEKNEEIGILSPVIYDNGKVWFSGGNIKFAAMKTDHSVIASTDELSISEYVTGCAMLIKKSVFKKAGLFDEDFFLYYEDADFCLRARRYGFKSAVTNSAKVFHNEKSNEHPEQKTYWLVFSGLIFFKKNTPLLFKPWVSIYLAMRKLKNRFVKNSLSPIVKKAYSDYKIYKKSLTAQ